jgi:hypothetical protein
MRVQRRTKADKFPAEKEIANGEEMAEVLGSEISVRLGDDRLPEGERAKTSDL